MNENFRIAFIGAGNLAWHLGPALENLGHRISHVYNRSAEHAYQLTRRLYRAEYKKDLDFSGDQVDMVIMAVSDQVIPALIGEIILPDDCQLIHTSGSQSLKILEPSAAAHIGVLYPLQTFSRGANIDFHAVPVFLESSSQRGMQQLFSLTKGLSENIQEADSHQRSILHLAAVLSTNFSNYLFTVAKQILDKHDIDYKLLHPVAQTMLDKVFTIGPESGQTGPAIRKDFDTMDWHIELLKEEKEDLMEVYSILSKQIINTGKN
jgi:predicted short-subunit dehydrogenase-like oxidoreductase (DUF2520 family)